MVRSGGFTVPFSLHYHLLAVWTSFQERPSRVGQAGAQHVEAHRVFVCVLRWTSCSSLIEQFDLGLIVHIAVWVIGVH